MKLFEHADFEQAILRAAEHFRDRGLRPAIIEKDYYVTEALRIIAVTAPDKIIFKGGTSLAKGWNLIQRFSEDIDIFLDPLSFKPTLGKNAIDRELKKLRDAVGRHPALTLRRHHSGQRRHLLAPPPAQRHLVRRRSRPRVRSLPPPISQTPKPTLAQNLHSSRRRAGPSVVSDATTVFPTRNASAAPAKSPTASSSKPAPPAAANPPPSSNCVRIWGSS
jgi:hypothetical protein